jgi:biopolymer transport protein ExbB
MFAALQMTHEGQGWLSSRLLGVTLGSADWVLWILVVLSIASIAIMLERAFYFSSNRLPNADALAAQVAKGEYEAVLKTLEGKKGMEAAVLKAALTAREKGADSVEEVIAETLSRQRPQYERFLGFLGTLGSNAPFIGLFGTVLGIIKSFNDLSSTGVNSKNMQTTVMAGISEALVATAVGLAVAIPAVVAYNVLTRSLKNLTARTNALGHAVVGHLRATGGR